MDALRPLSISPGDYLLPRPTTREEMRSAEFAEKMKKGPVLMLTVFPNGPMSMGRNLGLWFAYALRDRRLRRLRRGPSAAAGRSLPARVPLRRRDRCSSAIPRRSGRCRSGIAAPGR